MKKIGPLVCVPIRATNLGDAEAALASAADLGADLAEIWLDYFKAPPDTAELVRLFGESRIPCMAVCKDASERGKFRGGENERVARLINAADDGAAYVDCGLHEKKENLKKLQRVRRKNRVKLILSHHEWNSTPKLEKLLLLAKRSFDQGADIFKIATSIRSWADAGILFELCSRLSFAKQPFIVIGMGKKGKITRLGCPFLGSKIIYAALNEQQKTAPGQITLAEWRRWSSGDF